MKPIIFIVLMTFSLLVSASGMNDDPLLFKVTIDQLETCDTEQNQNFVWEAEAWVGKDLKKLVLKTHGEYDGNQIEHATEELLYGFAVDPNWDMQVGIRGDHGEGPSRTWLAIGFSGVAPYFVESDLFVYVNDEVNVSLELKLEKEIMITQKLVLTPEFEATINTKTDTELHKGSGFSAAEFGLRLAYEFRREFAPYIGIVREAKYGKTAKFVLDDGGEPRNTAFVAGVRIWF